MAKGRKVTMELANGEEVDMRQLWSIMVNMNNKMDEVRFKVETVEKKTAEEREMMLEEIKRVGSLMKKNEVQQLDVLDQEGMEVL